MIIISPVFSKKHFITFIIKRGLLFRCLNDNSMYMYCELDGFEPSLDKLSSNLYRLKIMEKYLDDSLVFYQKHYKK